MFILLALALLAAVPARGQYCPNVAEPAQRATIDSVLLTYHVDSCCASKLGDCCIKKRNCYIATHLAEFGCFLTLMGKNRATIVEELDKRQQFFFSSAPPSPYMDLSLLPPAGDSAAPVTIVVYINSTCPLCKMVSVPLFQEVTQGAVAGLVKLSLVPLSVQTGNIAYLAAAQLGKFWEYYLALAKQRGRLDEEDLILTAEYLGIPRPKLKKLLADKSLEQKLTKNHEKAEKMDVKVTPTVFINGKRYESHKDPQWILDAALFEYQRRTEK